MIFLMMVFVPLSSIAQSVDEQSEAPTVQEVLFSFRYQGVNQVYIPGLYQEENDRVYIPVGEVFSLLGINHSIQRETNSIEGFFLDPDDRYLINFSKALVEYKGEVASYSKNSLFLVRELDYFIAPIVLDYHFGLGFEIDMNTLTVTLQTDDTMPVVEEQQRERARSRMQEHSLLPETYPLLHDRNRAVFNSGFLDYSMSALSNINNQDNYYTYRFVGGAEFAGGDLQGDHSGSLTPEGNLIYRTRNLRWRYVVRENPYFSQFSVGQVRTNGLQTRRIQGVSLSNDPVEPRRLQGRDHIIEGTTEPNSEVELYVNNTLIDYTRADGLGMYRFEVPLRYGTTRIRKQIYTPGGREYTDEDRIRVPFQFLPPGVVTYNVEAGTVDPGFYRDVTDKALIHGNVSVGLTDWLTAQAGTEYIDRATEHPFLYGSLSGRFLSQYLVNVDIAPEAFYRVRGSVVSPSSRSFSVNYSYFTGPSIYNVRDTDQFLEANFYTPVQLGRFHTGIRVGGEHLVFAENNQTRYTGDLYFRLGRLNLRLNYRDDIIVFNDRIQHGVGQIRGSATYTLSRKRTLPSVLRGVYIRMSALYERKNSQFRWADIQLSKNVLNSGRFYIGTRQDLQAGVTRIEAGLSINIGNSLRSRSDYQSIRNNHTFRQNIRGSIGFDEASDRFTFNALENTGRAAASVVLYIDNNNSGTFDNGDEILPYAGIRLDRSSHLKVGSDGVVRLTQLQSYYRYNVEVNRNAIPNPLLVPSQNRFSFIADPNQYKRIEIPFYRSGVIEGKVYIQNGEDLQGRGGIRLLLNAVNGNYSEVIRTFHGGGFYAMDIPPGNYILEVDPSQLEFLGVKSREGALEFEVESIAEGDFLEGMDIILVEEEK